MSRAFLVSTRKANAAAHAAPHGMTGLLKLSKMFDPTERSSTLIGSIDPRSVIELALVHRLASLLWRLGRASAIETGLFEIQGELLLACRQAPSQEPSQPGTLPTPIRLDGHSKGSGSNHQEPLSTSLRPPLGPWSTFRAIAQCFLRLSNLDPTLLERVSAYEIRLWRQAAQTIRTLDAMRRPPTAPARPRFRKPIWDWDRRIKEL